MITIVKRSTWLLAIAIGISAFYAEESRAESFNDILLSAESLQTLSAEASLPRVKQSAPVLTQKKIDEIAGDRALKKLDKAIEERDRRLNRIPD